MLFRLQVLELAIADATPAALIRTALAARSRDRLRSALR
jgi:hypothetical protein